MTAEEQTKEKTISDGDKGTYQFLATMEELRKDGQLTRWIDDSNICRHFGGPVGYHKAKDGVFTCLWHNWRYSCADGACLSYPGLSLRQYGLKIDGDKIYINLLG